MSKGEEVNKTLLRNSLNQTCNTLHLTTFYITYTVKFGQKQTMGLFQVQYYEFLNGKERKIMSNFNNSS